MITDPMKQMVSLFFLFITISVYSQKKLTLSIRFENRFGNELLVPEQSYVMNNDTVTINRFKYYVSHFYLTNEKGKKIILPLHYYLIDASDENSLTLSLDIPIENYTGIHFLLGVDSLRNVSGVQTGALDPLHGMFWTWNSGYIMAKLEGKASSSEIAGKQFTYHIGGFRTGHNTSRNISIPIPSFSQQLTIIADAKKWFNGPHQLTIAKEPVCHSPGALAVRIANNYATMFSLKE